ncbi:MAG: carbon-monoxide dehydrogenase large subunit [Acidobacteriota bacterium]
MPAARKVPRAARLRTVGRDVLRLEGRAKLTGEARYVADLEVPGALWGLTVRSPHPHAELLAIRRDPAFDWSGVTVVTGADVARLGCENVVALIEDDQPFLVERLSRHAEEPVALVAAPTREAAEEAARHLAFDWRPLEPQLDFERSTAVFKEIAVTRGDAAGELARAERVIEGDYRFGAQEQAYLENNGVVALPGEGGGVTLLGSMQCPYYVHRGLVRLLRAEAGDVRVIQTVTGGGFGGKEEYPIVIAGHAALLARAAGRPVRLLYDRAEDMVATTKRHPGRIRHRTGFDRDGRLAAAEVEILLDGGAYATLSPVVLSRAALHALGPYACDHVAVRARAVATHTPPNGAFRGFGVPQACWAVERHLDVAAAALALDRVELRRRNLLEDGGTLPTGQRVSDAGASRQTLDAVLARSRWRERERSHAAFNRRSRDRRRGLGLACYFHGTGFTGSGELKLASRVALELTADGRVRILTASTEIGQGTRTVFAQIVAETLGLPIGRVEVADADTAVVPDSGPTVASRTVAIVGRILVDAARALDGALRASSGRPAERSWNARDFAAAAARHLAAGGTTRFEARFSNPSGQVWDDATYRGDAYGAYAWAATVVEVEVDLATFEVSVLGVTSAQEIGRAVHPRLAEGQLEGGLAQALGWGLCEDVVFREGRMANGRLTNYILPTSADLPAIDLVLLERPWAHGPFGAKGIGELPMDGGAPAAVNAIARALGVDLRRIPATPERIAEAMVASLPVPNPEARS